MDWTEIVINVGVRDLETAENIANMVVPYGIYTEDYSNLENEVMEIAHVDLIDDELLSRDRDTAKIHVYISEEDNPYEAITFLSERLKGEKIDFTVDELTVKEDDWLNNWRKYFNPMEIGEKLLINPSWLEKKKTDRKILSIDPGLAFGTGKHETTKLCLEALEKYIKPDSHVLDVGCGSGILSIAALLLGAEAATGVDIDPIAVNAAKENASENRVDDRYTVICGDLTDNINGKYNVVVANIVADAIISLTENITDFMDEKAVYIVSGIIDTRVDDVKNAVKNQFDLIEENTQNGWYCLVLTEKIL